MGCVTLGPAQQADLTRPLAIALLTPRAAVQARAETGEAEAQLALAIIYRYGLNAAPIDPREAARWVGKAGGPRGFIPVTQYIAGYKGRPGRVITTSIPRYDVSAMQVAVLNRCTALLSAPPASVEATHQLAEGVCGGPANYARLSALWARARPS